MAIEQDLTPKNRSDILTWVSIGLGLAGFIMACLPYIVPPDPAHPVRFHFLFRTVSIPLWGTVLGIVAIAGGSFRLGQGRSKKTRHDEPPPEPIKPKAYPVKRPNPQPMVKATTPPQAIRTGSQNGEAFAFETTDHYTVRIGRMTIRDTNGLAITIHNNRLDTLGKIAFTIFSAQSFSERHGKFREPFGFPAAQMVYQGNILADTSGLPFWIVRKEDSKGYLLAADDQSHPMNWPDGDPVEIQKWVIRLQVTSQTVPAASGTSPKAFSTQPFNIVVTWNSTANEFFVDGDPDEKRP
jgi:hypothetical protein